MPLTETDLVVVTADIVNFRHSGNVCGYVNHATFDFIVTAENNKYRLETIVLFTKNLAERCSDVAELYTRLASALEQNYGAELTGVDWFSVARNFTVIYAERELERLDGTEGMSSYEIYNS